MTVGNSRYGKWTFCALSLFGVGCEGGVPLTQKASPPNETRVRVQGGVLRAVDLNTPEVLAWGPPGLFATADGFLIPDNATHTLVEVDAQGQVLRTADVSASTVSIADIVSEGDSIVVLERGGMEPMLARFSAADFSFIDSTRLPLEWGQVTGINHDDFGLIVEVGGGERLFRVARWGEVAALEEASAYVWGGQPFSVTEQGGVRNLNIGDDTHTAISTPHRVGRAEILGPAAGGGVFVLVEDVEPLPVVRVEQTVWRINADGTIGGVARVPIEERITTASHGVAVGMDGEITMMIPLGDGVELRGATFGVYPTDTGRFDPPDEDVVTDTDLAALTTVPAGGCITHQSIIRNAAEYLNNSTRISLTSINNDQTCPGRTRPAYLGVAGNYGSVSYDWGGFDTPAQFNTAMTNNRKAGNLNTAGSLACAYGVDCSGFVSRAWGLTTKKSTNTLPGVSANLCPALRGGDILNRAGSHVVLFSGNAANGVNVYESTHYQNYDRVVHIYRPWSDLANYTAYRSATVCP